MKKNLTFFLLFSLLGITKAQLSGTAFLQSQSNHSGIRVKFISQGGTAVTDSAYTDAAGNYSINISPGVYVISYAKAGYIGLNYNNGTSMVLTNTVVLSNVTLTSGNAINVSGAVSGTWTPGNVYLVTGDITINGTLTILAGTVVKFMGFYSIGGNGIIKAMGNSSNPILFTSGKTSPADGDWKQIGLNSVGSLFDYCIIEFGTSLLRFQSGSANVTNCIMRNGSIGMYMGSGTPLIENNEIYDFYNSQIAIGIWVEGSATGTISCNNIHNLHCTAYNSYGIIHNSSLVKDNYIKNILGPNPKGIQSRYSNSRNYNNYITNCGLAFEVDGTWTVASTTIANNTFDGNSKGVVITGGHAGNLIVVNNLITNNNYGVTGFNSAVTFYIDHNDVWNNSSANYDGVLPTGIGQIVTTNSSGYPIDSYFNMSIDPIYNNSAPFLQANSPCYGTSNSAYSNQIGFDNPQGCAGRVISVLEWNRFDKVAVYPNPSYGVFTINNVDTKDEMQITIYDMKGELVHTCNTASGQQIKADHLQAGIYLLNVKRGASVGKAKLVIAK